MLLLLIHPWKRTIDTSMEKNTIEYDHFMEFEIAEGSSQKQPTEYYFMLPFTMPNDDTVNYANMLREIPSFSALSSIESTFAVGSNDETQSPLYGGVVVMVCALVLFSVLLFQPRRRNRIPEAEVVGIVSVSLQPPPSDPFMPSYKEQSTPHEQYFCVNHTNSTFVYPPYLSSTKNCFLSRG